MRGFGVIAVVAGVFLQACAAGGGGGARSEPPLAPRVPPARRVAATPSHPASVEVVPAGQGRSRVTFSHRPEGADAAVFVAGDFNGWNPTATRMERMGDGVFRATVEMENARVTYKFVVDGRWIADPANPEREPDGHDGFNSVLVTGGEAAEAVPVRAVAGFRTPEWAKHAVWYQIMLDRFANGNPDNDPPGTRPWTSSWRATSAWETRGGATFWEYAVFNRHYGGDLEGLRARIPYLRSLGVNAIYLMPVFEAPSAHKYNAATYVHIDDSFGTTGDSAMASANEDLLDPSSWGFSESDRAFLAALAELKSQGFRVIIDGVFNHVGDLHEAFLDVKEKGASSRYADWFVIEGFEPFRYRGWAGFGELPEFRKDAAGIASASAKAHLFAITRRWMDPDGDGDPSDGVDGWRLDVPNEVPMGFWREWRTLVKSINPDAYLVGEVWRRADAWLDGTTFDATMNYPFAETVLAWIGDRGRRITVGELDARLALLRATYPAEATYAMQNLVDSHDTDRLVSMLANPDRGYDRANSERPGSAYDGARPSEEAYRKARLVALLQMCYVGAPMVWYGDEAGMWGSDDPFCRKPMVWRDLGPFEDPEERFDERHWAHYRAVIALRNSMPALRTGSFRTIVADDARDLWVFERRLGDERVLVALNASGAPQSVELPAAERDGWRWSVVFDGDGAGSGAVGDGATRGPRLLESIPPVAGRVLRGVR